jgi:hypothetical protein
MISDQLNHDTSTVNEFQKHLISEKKTVSAGVKKIIHFISHASNQYTNKGNLIKCANTRMILA